MPEKNTLHMNNSEYSGVRGTPQSHIYISLSNMILKIYKPFFIEVIEVFDLEEAQRYLILLERVNSEMSVKFYIHYYNIVLYYE